MYAKVAHKIVLRSPIIGTDCSHNYLGLNFNAKKGKNDFLQGTWVEQKKHLHPKWTRLDVLFLQVKEVL
jgi:hypothetical protein